MFCPSDISECIGSLKLVNAIESDVNIHWVEIGAADASPKSSCSDILGTIFHHFQRI